MGLTRPGNPAREQVSEGDEHEERRENEEQEPGESQPEDKDPGQHRPDRIPEITPHNEERDDPPPVLLNAEAVHKTQCCRVEAGMPQCGDDGKEHYQVIVLGNTHECDK